MSVLIISSLELEDGITFTGERNDKFHHRSAKIDRMVGHIQPRSKALFVGGKKVRY